MRSTSSALTLRDREFTVYRINERGERNESSSHAVTTSNTVTTPNARGTMKMASRPMGFAYPTSRA